MSPLVHELAQVVATRFAGVMQSVVTPEAEAVAFDGAVTPGWLVPCELAGAMTGTWYLAIGLEAPFTGLTVTVSKPATAPVAPGVAAGSFACRLDESNTLQFGCTYAAGSATAAQPAAAVAPSGRAAAAAPMVEKVPDNLELILDIDMPLTVRFGEAVLSMESLCRLGPGSLVELSRQPDDPVDVLINGRLVARGEVVVVAGNYGVRVTQVVSADERMRTLNG
jgi:flagellar motor switch protein FliN